MSNRNKPPGVEITWDEMKFAADGSAFTTLYLSVTGYWAGGRPTAMGMVVRKEGAEVLNKGVDLFGGNGQLPLMGLKPGPYEVCGTVDGGKEVRRLLVVETPKEKTEEEKDLEYAQKLRETTRVDLEKTELAEKIAEKDAHTDELLAAGSIPSKEHSHVDVSGWNGKYTFRIAVRNARKAPMKGVSVAIIGGDADEHVKTGEDDTATHRVDFKGRLRNFAVEAKGVVLWEGTLAGPVR